MADLKKKEVSRSRMAEFPAGTPLRSGDEFPTEDIICEALENKSFERLNNCLVTGCENCPPHGCTRPHHHHQHLWVGLAHV